YLNLLPRAASYVLFFSNDTPTTETYTLSLHDALPIYALDEPGGARKARAAERAHRLLRPVGQKHRPERQPQSQQSQICQHLTPPTQTDNVSRNRDIRYLPTWNTSPGATVPGAR